MALLAVAGCAGDPGSTAPSSASSAAASQAAVTGEVVVFAAASLTEAFTQIGTGFEAAHPDAEVTFSFGASSALAQQVTSGAPADVFAAASLATMSVVSDAGDAEGEPEVFARNRLQIAVPTGNPGDVSGLADFADPARTIALCAGEVPCGAAAVAAFTAAGVTPAPDTLEQDVRAALSKVRLGEVDAALVYRTDVLAAGGAVEGIDVPEAHQAVNDYPITVLTDAPHDDAARAFVAYVLSEEGREVLTDAGFERP
jgi:molybdate transport system substrate-binding protein